MSSGAGHVAVAIGSWPRGRGVDQARPFEEAERGSYVLGLDGGFDRVWAHELQDHARNQGAQGGR